MGGDTQARDLPIQIDYVFCFGRKGNSQLVIPLPAIQGCTSGYTTSTVREPACMDPRNADLRQAFRIHQPVHAESCTENGKRKFYKYQVPWFDKTRCWLSGRSKFCVQELVSMSITLELWPSASPDRIQAPIQLFDCSVSNDKGYYCSHALR